MALKTWPMVTSPTGTVIGPPVSRTAAPRTMPSVGCSEMARTRLSPMCWATSRLRFVCLAAEVDLGGEQVVHLRHRVGGELDVDDRADDAGDPAGAARRSSLTGVVGDSGSHVNSSFLLGVCEGVGAADDLADLLGDLGLAGLVGQPGVGS